MIAHSNLKIIVFDEADNLNIDTQNTLKSLIDEYENIRFILICNYENQIIRYVYENYQNMTLDKLSKHFHYSLPYCSKLIKEITGFSFSKLLTQIKLQNGKNYLLNTQLSVESISEIIGYKNPETFIRVFKRYYDCSPSQYRKNQI